MPSTELPELPRNAPKGRHDADLPRERSLPEPTSTAQTHAGAVSEPTAKALLETMPEDLPQNSRDVVETACRLVGKVNYFWGGKSRLMGWDDRWGQIELVWANGDSSTDTYQLFGLDCSGFVDWVFYNASGGNYLIGQGGGTYTQHTNCTNIVWSSAQPGDLVFYPGDSHVGIVGG